MIRVRVGFGFIWFGFGFQFDPNPNQFSGRIGSESETFSSFLLNSSLTFKIKKFTPSMFQILFLFLKKIEILSVLINVLMLLYFLFFLYYFNYESAEVGRGIVLGCNSLFFPSSDCSFFPILNHCWIIKQEVFSPLETFFFSRRKVMKSCFHSIL